MIVKCCKPFNHLEYFERLGGLPSTTNAASAPSTQLTVGEIYLVIEVFIFFKPERASYRIIDNQGCPGVYESYCFEIVSGSLDGLTIKEISDSRGITITHKLIADSKLTTEYGGDFWDVYFDSSTDEATSLLEEVVKDLSLRENIPAPALEWY